MTSWNGRTGLVYHNCEKKYLISSNGIHDNARLNSV